MNQTNESVDISSIYQNVDSIALNSERTSVEIADIASTVRQNAKVAGEAAENAEQAVGIMQRFSDAVSAIGAMVTTINGIADKTNMLALNASIEAARAGDAGRGFSVVAGEVKELAQQTAKATAQIREQIKVIQQESETVSTSIGTVTEITANINEHAKDAARQIENKSSDVMDVARSIGAVRDALQKLQT